VKYVIDENENKEKDAQTHRQIDSHTDEHLI
jgi:hypothetical protein